MQIIKNEKIDVKLTIQFTVLTFIIVLSTWIPIIILSQFGITTINHAWIYFLQLLGAISPTIASYIAMKKNNRVKNFKEWIKIIFNVKIHILYYISAIASIAIFHILDRYFSGIVEIPPPHMIPIILLICFLMGGLEEAGWRCILQPELEKKFGFIISAIITGLIWYVWHLPLFFISDTAQSGFNIWMYLFICIMLSFLFGAFRKISGSVFLIIIAHTLSNAMAVGGIFISTWLGVIGSTIILALLSIIAVHIFDKKQKIKIS